MEQSSAERRDDSPVLSWKETISSLEGELDAQVFAAYIQPLKFVSFDDEQGDVVISGPSRLVCNHVNQNYRKQLIETFAAKLGVAVSRLTIEVDSTDGKPEVGRGRYVVVKKVRPLDESEVEDGDVGGASDLNPRYTFSSFVVGSSNQFCHAAAMQAAEKPGESYNPLFIYGGVGLGKTHLLHAIGNAVHESNPKAKVLYMSSETFTNELIHSLRHGQMNQFKNRLRSIEVLLIDDIQFMCGKERTQEEFFHTFNALYAAKHQIVITSDKIPQELPGIEERLHTRFAWGLTADLQAPDFETRVAILNRKASAESFALPKEVAHFISDSVSSNVRELEGALTRLHAISSLRSLPITLKLAQSALKPILEPKKVSVSVDEIKKAVATHFSIKVSEMVSKRRTRNLSFPRHVAMYLCRKHTTSSYPEIGNQFGGRDHSSVIHAANVVSAKNKNDPDVRQAIASIEKALFGMS